MTIKKGTPRKIGLTNIFYPFKKGIAYESTQAAAVLFVVKKRSLRFFSDEYIIT